MSCAAGVQLQTFSTTLNYIAVLITETETISADCLARYKITQSLRSISHTFLLISVRKRGVYVQPQMFNCLLISLAPHKFCSKCLIKIIKYNLKEQYKSINFLIDQKQVGVCSINHKSISGRKATSAYQRQAMHQPQQS